MVKNKLTVCTIFYMIILQILLCAQQVPVVAAFSLRANDVGENVTTTVTDLIFSFIKELKNYTLLDMRADTLPGDLRIPDGTDYLFYGSLIAQNDGLKLELILKGGPLNITRLISRVFENSNRILLESRALVQNLFDQTIKLTDPPDVPAVIPKNPPVKTSISESSITQNLLIPVTNIDSLAGSWQAEEGIEKIMILRGGRGVAVLTSGISISLELLLSNEQLIIRQKGSINPRQFMDLPDPVAKQASTIAPPLEWRFSITTDQQILKGIKKTVVIKNDGKNILTMESVTLEVDWTRY